MAFCGICGTKLNGQAFCPNCGTAVGNEVIVSGNTSVIYGQPKSERQMALEELDRVIDHFEEVKMDYSYYYVNAISAVLLPHKKILRWIFSMPAFFIGFAVLDDKITRTWPDFIRIAILLAAVVLPVAVPICLKIKNYGKIRQAKADASKYLNKVLEHYKTYPGECPVGFEFYNPEFLQGLRDMITSGRATTIPQAINLMLDDKHKDVMETRMALTQSAAESAAFWAKDASANSRAAARYASRAAVAAEGAFWNTL